MAWLKRSEIDDTTWNERVLACDEFRHYYLTYYLDACCEWMAWVDESANCFWPLPIKQRPFPQVYQPLLIQQLGPVPCHNDSQAWLDSHWQELERKFWRVNVKFHDRLKQLGSDVELHQNLELKLDQGYDELKRNYNASTKSNLRKFRKSGAAIVVSDAYSSECVEQFRADKGAAIPQLDDNFYADVENIFKAFLSRGQATTWHAEIDGVRLATAMILQTNGRMLNFFTHATIEGKKVGAMHGVLNAIFERHAGSARCFDFEGSNDPNLAFFYRGFGAEDKIYLQRGTKWFPPIFKRIFK